MQRRSFLGLATLGAASTTARLSFGASGTDETQRLAEALERASAVGKPLLVVVVPEDRAEAGRGGRLLGGFLGHAPDADLALLALCELTCIPRRDLEKKVGPIEDGTFAAILETGPSRPVPGSSAAWWGWIWRMPPATFRSSCTTGTSTLRPGAPTST